MTEWGVRLPSGYVERYLTEERAREVAWIYMPYRIAVCRDDARHPWVDAT